MPQQGPPQQIKAPPECYSSDPFIKQGCREACTYQTCPRSLSYWSYVPSLAANGFYLGFFILSLIVFMATNVARKRAFMSFSIIMVLGNVLEVIGYGGRILAHDKPFSPEPFLMQIIGLTLAPAFYAAAIYFCLSRIVTIIGAHNSRIPPARYPRIFIGCDVVALILQAAGGGIAASSKQNDTAPTTGANILIAGLSFQVFTMLVFILFVADFAIRTMRASRSGHNQSSTATTTTNDEQRQGGNSGTSSRSHRRSGSGSGNDDDDGSIKSELRKGGGGVARESEVDVMDFGDDSGSALHSGSNEAESIRGSKHFRAFLVAWAFATLCIFARCVYRVAELSEHNGGYLARTQIFFIILEGAVVVAAVASLNVFHPAFCLHKMPPRVLK